MDMFQGFVTVEEKENPVRRISPEQPSTTSDDRRLRRQGRRSIFPLHHAPAVAATTRISQWRHAPGSRVPSLRSALMQPTLIREYLLFLAVRELSLRDASPGSESSPSRLVGFRVAALAISPPL